MDFWSHIESKSSGVKAQYSFLIATFVTGIIGMVWVSTLPARFSSLSEPEELSAEDSPGLSELFSDTKSQLGNIIETTKETVVEESFNTESLDNLGEPSLREDDAEVNTMQASTTGEASVVVSPSVATTTPEANPEAKSPKMILIGTTTSQKVE
ncbi:MAG: hypothetical protein WAW13_02800 [Minisyncoccia bacterium]